LKAKDLSPAVERTLQLAAEKTLRLDRRWKVSDGAPVMTVAGRYTARSWTQWTQGFQYGNALMGFELTGDKDLLKVAQRHVIDDMAEHLTHTGVHDHGFNNISTYGHLRRLMLEGRICSATAYMQNKTSASIYWNARWPTPGPLRNSTFITAKDAISTTHPSCAGGLSTKPFSIPRASSSAARLLNKGTLRLLRGPGDSPGRCLASRS
jgi:hypothetical protein